MAAGRGSRTLEAETGAMPGMPMVQRVIRLSPLVRLGRGAISAHSFGDDFFAEVDPVGTVDAIADSLAGLFWLHSGYPPCRA